MYMMFKHMHYLVVSLSAIVLTVQFVAHYLIWRKRQKMA